MKKFLSLVLALVMTMSLVTVSAGAKDFTDDSSIAYKEAVDVISGIGVVDGYSGGDFKPGEVLTRGAAAKIICNLILGPTTASALSANTAPFKDVPVTNTFAGYITYCSQQGIINGYADGTFRPTGTLTGNAFMKMLLGALGYDSSIEKYTGANWNVAVIKQAVGIGLDDGNDEFVGSKAVTREEAALYAFNMLQATMVEYEQKSTIVVDGVEINTSSTRSEVKNEIAKDNTIETDGKMQFAEKYFSDLKKVRSDSDEFERPAITWKFKSNTIGTYTDEADLTYTEEVKLGDIYKDLGLSSNLKKDDVKVYVDGASATSNGIVKGDETNKLGGNGVLTEVFYDSDNDSAIITLVNTYLGTVTSTHAASGSRDAYITVESKYDTLAVSGGNFDTEESYDVDDLVLFSYSYKTGDKGVQNVRVAPNAVTGTLSSFTAGKSVTVSDTQYKANNANKGEIKDLENAVDNDLTVYLDEYGYVVYVDTDAIDNNYAVVLGYTTGTGSVAQTVKLLTTDGSTMNVSVKSIDKTNADSFDVGDIVSYSKTSNNEYKLKVLADKNSLSKNTRDDYTVFTKGSAAVGLQPADAKQGNLTSAPATVTGVNGKTIFLVATRSGSNEVYNVYQGIANVPTITVKKNATPEVSIYVKDVNSSNEGAAKVVFIDATNTGDIEMSGLSKDAVFVKGSTSIGASYDNKLGTYYEYDAIINGEFGKIKSADRVTDKTLFGDVTYDANGVATLSNGIGTPTAGVIQNVNGNVKSGIGIDKSGDDVMVLGGTDYLTLADGYKVYKLNTAGDIDETAYTNFSKDNNDKVWVKIVNGDVTTIVIWEQDPAAEQFSLSAVANADFSLDNSTWTATSAEAGKTVYVKAKSGYKMLTTGDLALTSEGSGVYSFTMPERALVASDIDLATTYNGKVEVKGGSISTGYYDATFYNKDNDGPLSVAQMVEALVAEIGDNGGVVTNQNFGTGDVSYTYNGGSYSVQVTTSAQVYKVDNNGTVSYLPTGTEVIASSVATYYSTDGGASFKNSAQLSVATSDITVISGFYKVSGELSQVSGSLDSASVNYEFSTELTSADDTGYYVSGDTAWYVKADAVLTMTFKNAAKVTAVTKDKITVTAANSVMDPSTGVVEFAKDTEANTEKPLTLTNFTNDVTVSVAGATE